MRRSAIAAVLFAATIPSVACYSRPPECPPPPSLVVQDLRSMTPALVTADDGRVFCSAVWIGDHTMVTAAHCVDDVSIGGEVMFVTEDVDDRRFVSALALIDPDHDLAILFSESHPNHAVATIGGTPSPGDKVFTMGHPLGLTWSFSCGYVSAIRRADLSLDIDWIQSTAAISPGNSGGGLFSENGTLLGIASRQLTRGQALNFWVPSKYISIR